MKLQIIQMETDDYRCFEKIVKNGKVVYSARDLTDCPEDAIIGRDLLSSHELIGILRKFAGEEIPQDSDIEIIKAKTRDDYNRYGET